MTDKTCPFKHVFDEKMRKCDGPATKTSAGCQLWVRLGKDNLLNIGENRHAVDPDTEFIYEGCGLVTAIPWTLVNKARVKKHEN